MAKCIVGQAIHVFINRSLRTLRVVLNQLCTGKVSSTSYAPSQVLVANNFVVVKFWTTCISFISSFSTIYITIFFWYTSSIDVLASEIINIKYKVCFMKEKMAIPVPGPQKSCYPPSERFSRHHEVVTITTHTKHIYKKCEGTIPLCHP